MKKIFFSTIAMMVCAISANAELNPATFENEEGGIQVTAENPVWRGGVYEDDEELLWKSGDFTCVTFVDDWGTLYYYDVTVSNLQNTTFDFSNPNFDQYAAAGKAAQGNNYAVWYYNYNRDVPEPEYDRYVVQLEDAQVISGMAVTNNTYAVDAILNGDGISVEEAGTGLPFHAGDYFKLIVVGYNNDVEVATKEFYLADFRSANPKEWVYAENWQWLDLTSLGEVDALGFKVETTKHNTYGGTTPSYFCFDNLGGSAADCELGAMTHAFVPATFENEEGGIQVNAENPVWRGGVYEDDEELFWKSGDFTCVTFVDDWGTLYYYDVTVSNLQNTTFDFSNPNFDQYAAAGKAAQGNNYAVWYYNYNRDVPEPEYDRYVVQLEDAQVISGMAVTNNTYAVDAILNGDGISVEEAGTGLPFHAGDYFKLIVVGYNNDVEVATKEFYLADFRSANPKEWVYAENWQWLDLTSLGEVDALGFKVETTKHNTYGGTTPSYFCFDNLGGSPADCELGAMTELEAQPLPTAIDNTNAAVKATKMIRNGQVIIIRDGKAFNILGAEL